MDMPPKGESWTEAQSWVLVNQLGSKLADMSAYSVTLIKTHTHICITTCAPVGVPTLPSPCSMFFLPDALALAELASALAMLLAPQASAFHSSAQPALCFPVHCWLEHRLSFLPLLHVQDEQSMSHKCLNVNFCQPGGLPRGKEMVAQGGRRGESEKRAWRREGVSGILWPENPKNQSPFKVL